MKKLILLCFLLCGCSDTTEPVVRKTISGELENINIVNGEWYQTINIEFKDGRLFSVCTYQEPNFEKTLLLKKGDFVVVRYDENGGHVQISETH